MEVMNPQRKLAMKRLVQDLAELESTPLEDISARPLECNFFEWHCNLVIHGLVHHLILSFPDTYPQTSPKAEFMPPGFRFYGGASMAGTKGVKVCLSLFDDYAYIHRHWATDIESWSATYTVQSVLLNLLAYMQDMGVQNTQGEYNKTLLEEFECVDCGHSHGKPYPPLSVPEDETMEVDEEEKDDVIERRDEVMDVSLPPVPARTVADYTDYISKDVLNLDYETETASQLFGFGLYHENRDGGKYVFSPCEIIKAESFDALHEANDGVVKSIMKKDLFAFLPLIINDKHANKELVLEAVQKAVKLSVADANSMFYKKVPEFESDPHGATFTVLLSVLRGITEVFVTQPSERLLSSFLAVHRLLYFLCKEYPELADKTSQTLQETLAAISKAKDLKRCSAFMVEIALCASVRSPINWTDLSGQLLASFEKCCRAVLTTRYRRKQPTVNAASVFYQESWQEVLCALLLGRLVNPDAGTIDQCAAELDARDGCLLEGQFEIVRQEIVNNIQPLGRQANKEFVHLYAYLGHVEEQDKIFKRLLPIRMKRKAVDDVEQPVAKRTRARAKMDCPLEPELEPARPKKCKYPLRNRISIRN